MSYTCCPAGQFCTASVHKATHKHTPSSANSSWIALETRCGRRSAVADSTYVIGDSRTLPRRHVWTRAKQRLKSWKQKKNTFFSLRVVHKSNTQHTHTILGEFLMDCPGNSLRTKINCSRQHVCHHRQSDVAPTVCVEKGKAEAKVMETGEKKHVSF